MVLNKHCQFFLSEKLCHLSIIQHQNETAFHEPARGVWTLTFSSASFGTSFYFQFLKPLPPSHSQGLTRYP